MTDPDACAHAPDGLHHRVPDPVLGDQCLWCCAALHPAGSGLPELLPSPGGWLTRFAATDACCLGRARRVLREQLRTDAGDLAAPDGYVTGVWVGPDEIADAARTIREQRALMQGNGLDQLEYALSEVASIPAGHGPPVLLLGVQPLAEEPKP